MTRYDDEKRIGAPAEPVADSHFSRRSGFARVAGASLTICAAAAGLVLLTPSIVGATDPAGVYEAIRSSVERRAPQRVRPQRVAPREFFAPDPRRVAPQPYWGPRFGALPPQHQRIPDAAPPTVPAPPPEAAPAPLRPFVTVPQVSASASTGERTICVRMCDGYQFPLGELQSRRDLPLHERACMSACPGAPVKLFTVAADSEYIDEARARDGARYRALPMAYANQRRYDSTCSCQGPNRRVAPRVPITSDMTLRRGDMVVTKDGVLVFNGKQSRKGVTMASFDDFRKTSALSQGEKRRVDAMMGYSERQLALQEFKRSLEAGDSIDVTHTGSVRAQ